MRSDLIHHVLSFIDHPQPDRFADLALSIHRYQHTRDAVLRALCPAPATTLSEIPAVPVGLFRTLSVGTVEDAPVRFHTSGTTGDPGVHRLLDTTLYDHGALTHASRWLPHTVATFALMENGEHSSLAHMIRLFAPITGPVRFLQDADGLHPEEIPSDRPVFVCSTAFALDAWLQLRPPPLAPGSAILTTGGFKGRAHQLDPEDLITAAQAVAPVVLEYGMTELSSQLWATPGALYEPPPWLRITAVDPDGSLCPPGRPGQLRFLDLCNLDSTVHIETNDHGVVHPDGRVELLGRLPQSELRGCSLSAEDLL